MLSLCSTVHRRSFWSKQLASYVINAHQQRQQHNHNNMKDRFRAKPDNKYTPKNWQAMNERADDQIAPNAAAHSIDALQRWALATANIAQNGHRANEAQTMERIQNRYANPNGSGALFQNPLSQPNQEVAVQGVVVQEVVVQEVVVQEVAVQGVAVQYSSKVEETTAMKRKQGHSTSYNGDVLSSEDTGDAKEQESKRRRLNDVSETEEDAKYAQSSEWSFPSEDEVKP